MFKLWVMNILSKEMLQVPSVDDLTMILVLGKWSICILAQRWSHQKLLWQMTHNHNDNINVTPTWGGSLNLVSVYRSFGTSPNHLIILYGKVWLLIVSLFFLLKHG